MSKKQPRLVCLLCGLIVMQRWVRDEYEGRVSEYWEDFNYPSKCVANGGGEHIDPEDLTGVQVEAVLAIRRKWLNP